MRKLRAHFSSEVVDGVICIEDADDGAASVTNDAEAVVEFVVDAFGDRPIVYRDTDGRWDGLGHNGNRFTDFIMIGAHDRPNAIRAALA